MTTTKPDGAGPNDILCSMCKMGHDEICSGNVSCLDLASELAKAEKEIAFLKEKVSDYRKVAMSVCDIKNAYWKIAADCVDKSLLDGVEGEKLHWIAKAESYDYDRQYAELRYQAARNVGIKYRTLWGQQVEPIGKYSDMPIFVDKEIEQEFQRLKEEKK